jgi:hypothetical protein
MQTPEAKIGGAPETPASSALIIPADYPRGAIELLRSWREGDDEDRREQQETWALIERMLEHDPVRI